MKELDVIAKALAKDVIKYLIARVNSLKEPHVTFNNHKHDLLRNILSRSKITSAQLTLLAMKVGFQDLRALKGAMEEPFLKEAMATKLWAQLLIHLNEHYLTILEYEVVETEASVNQLKKLVDIKNTKISSH